MIFCDYDVVLIQKTVLLTSVAQISRKTRLALNELSCPLRVVSGRSTAYQANGRYRGKSGHRMSGWWAQKNPARGRVFSFPGSGGTLWALLAQDS